MAAGSLYLLLFGGCFVFLLVAGACAWLLYVLGRRREAVAAEARAARRAARPQERDAAPELSDHRGSDDDIRRGTP